MSKMGKPWHLGIGKPTDVISIYRSNEMRSCKMCETLAGQSILDPKCCNGDDWENHVWLHVGTIAFDTKR